jgi:ABC-type cobalamin/Fe3+-siderophores transport system ATPase subunit
MPNAEIAAQLKEKNLVMFVGPAAVGKSYLMNRIMERDIDFGRVAVFTTREAREDDEPGMFRNIPHDDANLIPLLAKIQRGEVVQYAIHPTSGRIYGTEPGDYPRSFNMLATLSGVVNHLRQLPFQTTHVIGLAVEPDVWLRRFYARPMSPEERAKRLQEAIVSLQWLLNPANIPEITWVNNTSEDDSAAVQSVINAVKYNKPGDDTALRVAQAMLERLQKELQ